MNPDDTPYRTAITDFPQKPVIPPTVFNIDNHTPVVTPVYHTVLGRIADALEELVEQGKPVTTTIDFDQYPPAAMVRDDEDDHPRSGKVYWAPLGHTDGESPNSLGAPYVCPEPINQTFTFDLKDISPLVLDLFYGRQPETVFVEAPAEGFDFDDIDWELYNEMADWTAPILLPLKAEAVEALGEFTPVEVDLLAEGVFIESNLFWDEFYDGDLDRIDVYPHLAEYGDGSAIFPRGWDGFPELGFYRMSTAGLAALGYEA